MYSKTRDRIIEKRAEGRQRMGGGRGKDGENQKGAKVMSVKVTLPATVSKSRVYNY